MNFLIEHVTVQIKQMFLEAPVRIGAQEIFTQSDEASNVRDSIWLELM
jgi:hypothetical protein